MWMKTETKEDPRSDVTVSGVSYCSWYFIGANVVLGMRDLYSMNI